MQAETSSSSAAGKDQIERLKDSWDLEKKRLADAKVEIENLKKEDERFSEDLQKSQEKEVALKAKYDGKVDEIRQLNEKHADFERKHDEVSLFLL